MGSRSRNFAARDLHFYTVHGVVIVREDFAAARNDARFKSGVLPRDLRVNRLMILLTDHVSGNPRANFRDRLGAHGDDHFDLLFVEKRQRLASGRQWPGSAGCFKAARTGLLRIGGRRYRDESNQRAECDQAKVSRPACWRRFDGHSFGSLHVVPPLKFFYLTLRAVLV